MLPHPIVKPAGFFIRAVAGAGALLACAGTLAAEFPSRAVTLLVPYPAGGTTDLMARAIAQSLAKQFGQPVLVDNKGGAGGTVGATALARGPTDGYTIMLGGPSDQINAPAMMAKPPYDPARDFEPVGCVVRFPNVLVVNPALPVKSVAELVALAKKEPGKLNYASAGNGNSSHLSGELFAQTAGISVTHVPYRGNAPAVTDTIGGQTQMMFAATSSVQQFIKGGKLRAIAVTSNTRVKELPNVPTLREAGVAIDIYSWGCVVVSSKTPADVVDKLNAALTKSLDDPAVSQAIEATGGEKYPTSRAEAKRFLTAERTTWTTLIRSRNIHAD